MAHEEDAELGLAPSGIRNDGLTILPHIPSTAPEAVDYVFLHGLNGHPQRTWEHPTTKFYWPAQLRQDIPGARVMMFGYNAEFELALTSNTASIRSIAETLVGMLISERLGPLKDRPLIFIAHSLGGLVVKRALISMHEDKSTGLETRRLREQNAVYNSTKGLISMGTPHGGSNISKKARVKVLKLIANASFIKAPENILKALEANSDELLGLTASFEKTTIFTRREIEMCSYRETRTTAGLGELIVPEAMTQLHYGNAHHQPIEADHSGIVKFDNVQNPSYRSVMSRISSIGAEALDRETHINDQRITYRIQRFPKDIDRHSFPIWLSRNVQDIGEPDNIRVYTVASQSRTATLSFKRTPALFQDDGIEWTVPTEYSGLAENIIIDTHFRGLTVLNDVHPDQHILDCIAISGLAEHPFGCWQYQPHSAPPFMWLRDGATIDFRRVRVLLYGHGYELAEDTPALSLEDIALSLLRRLGSVDDWPLTTKPLAFLAHSLGGTILKQALLWLAGSSESPSLSVDIVSKIIMFGVPNRGIPTEHLIPMVCEAERGEVVPPVTDFFTESPYSLELENQFTSIAALHKIRVVSVYEMKGSRTARICDDGWDLNGPIKLLVEKDAAIQPSSNLSQDWVPIRRDHSNLIKLQEADADHKVVASHITTLCEALARETSENDKGLTKKQIRWTGTFVTSTIGWLKSIPKELPPYISFSFPTATKLRQSRVGDRETEVLLTNYSVFDQRASDFTTQVSTIDLSHVKRNLLASLEKEASSQRFDDVESAIPDTFEWIWHDASLRFESWLREGTGVYWINGKPGSGKSTLMKYILQDHRTEAAFKYILQDPRTEAALKYIFQDNGTEAASKGHILANFFFLNRGTYKQRSLEGLLCSLLYQILKQEPVLMDDFLPMLGDKFQSGLSQWTLSDLRGAFELLKSQKRANINILIFIDAVDEFDGDPKIMASFIKEAVESLPGARSQVRICFSSQHFEEFQQFHDCLKFKVEEQTRQDLQSYVLNRLNSHASTRSLLLTDGHELRYREVVEWTSRLAERAEGVFLYLKGVFDEVMDAYLASGMLHRDDIFSKIQVLVDGASIPKSLNECFERQLKRIPEALREESYIMLEILLRYDGKIGLLKFHSITKYVVAPKLAPSDREPSNIDDIMNWVRSRCGNLIGFDEQDGISPQFMHQTVKKFVSDPGFQWRILKHHSLYGQNGDSFLAQYGLGTLFDSWHRQDSVMYLDRWRDSWEKFLLYARHAESSTGRSQKALFDKISDEVFRWAGSKEQFRYFYSKLSYAVTTDLRLYVTECLEMEQIPQDPIKPLLHCVVEATISHVWSHNRPAVRNDPAPDLAEMAQLLLNSERSLSSDFEIRTAFELLLSDSFEGFGNGKGSDIRTGMVRLADVFLKHDPSLATKPIKVKVMGWQTIAQHKAEVLCTPLHVASTPDMIKLLLSHGADINALDDNGDGFTPLDICLGAVDHLARTGENKAPIRAYEAAATLVSRGGCITQRGKKSLELFLFLFKDELDKQGKDPNTSVISNLLRKPPILKKHRWLRGIFKNSR